jgi:hypothetical protein
VFLARKYYSFWDTYLLKLKQRSSDSLHNVQMYMTEFRTSDVIKWSLDYLTIAFKLCWFIESNYRTIPNYELENIRKAAVLLYFKVSQTEENHERPQRGYHNSKFKIKTCRCLTATLGSTYESSGTANALVTGTVGTLFTGGGGSCLFYNYELFVCVLSRYWNTDLYILFLHEMWLQKMIL